MTRSIYRSGRVAHVWHRQRPDLTGHYFIVRGGREIGPYRDAHDAPAASNVSITRIPRRSDAP